MTKQFETNEENLLWTNHDQPIDNFSEDRLDREKFTNALVNAISRWSSPNSLVLALNAPWGYGKTSVKNLLLSSLKSDIKTLNVVQFSPWQWAGSDQLSDAFFDEIAIVLGSSSRSNNRKVTARWRRYAARLKGGSRAVRSLVSPLRSLFIFVAILCGLGTVSRLFIGIGVAVLLGLAVVLTFSANLLESLAELRLPAQTDTERSLEEIRNDLAKELAKVTTSVLVVIDDLDRLSPKHLSEVIQLVKANGDLPNMIYLLLGDRTIIAKHIGAALNVDGDAYLEKIVQVSLDLPLAAKWRIHEVLFQGLNNILAPQAIAKTFNPTYWQEVLVPLSSYFDNLRNVNRFLTTLAFHTELFLADTAFEVNVVDLIALEAIRLFEPEVYKALPKNRKILIGESGYSKLSKQDAEAALSIMVDDVSIDDRPSLQELLYVIFPYLSSILQNGRGGMRSSGSLSRSVRVASERHFDKYFEFMPDPRELGERDIQRFLGSTSRQEFFDVLDSLRKRGLLDSSMQRLRDYVSDIPKTNVYAALLALCDIGDSLSRDAPGMFAGSPNLQGQFLASSLLEQLTTKDTGFAVLEKLLEESTGLSMPIHLIHGAVIKNKEGRDAYGMNMEQVGSLKASAVIKFAAAATSGSLSSQTDFRLFVLLWKEWGGIEGVRQYIQVLTSTPSGVLSFLAGMLLVAQTSAPNKEGRYDRPYIRFTEIDDLADSVHISSLISLQDVGELLPSQARAVASFKRAMNRKLAGKSDDGVAMMWEDDDES